VKPFRQAIIFVVLLHAAAAVGLAAWLGFTDRISRDRLERVTQLFRHTLEQERALDELAAQRETEAIAAAQDAARMRMVATGPTTVADALSAERQADEVETQKLTRLRRELADLQSYLDATRQSVAGQQAELEAKAKAFDERVKQFEAQRNDENFQQTVAMFEQLKSDQAKGLFVQMMADGREDEVVDYLAAMQLRKAAAVFKEFETPAEIVQATELMRRLRQRGMNELPDSVGAAATGGANGGGA
jgi:hypothetical protein